MFAENLAENPRWSWFRFSAALRVLCGKIISLQTLTRISHNFPLKGEAKIARGNAPGTPGHPYIKLCRSARNHPAQCAARTPFQGLIAMLASSRGVAPGYFRMSFQDVEEKAFQELFPHLSHRTCEKCGLRKPGKQEVLLVASRFPNSWCLVMEIL